MNSTDKIRAYLAEGKRLEERLGPGPWHIGHVDENNDGADIDTVEGETVAFVYHRPEQSFICDSRTRVEKYRAIIEELVEGLSAVVLKEPREDWPTDDDLDDVVCRARDALDRAARILEGK